MRHTLANACLAAAAMLAAASAHAPVHAHDGSEWDGLVERTSFPLREAIDRGLKVSGEGKPFHVELELDKGRLVYSVDVAQGTQTCNVVLDVKDGAVVEKETEDEDHADLVAACSVTLADAIDVALARRPGHAIEAELHLAKNGKPFYAVRVLAGGTVEVVQIEAVSGDAAGAAAVPASPADDSFTRTFRVAQDEWSSTGSNPYFVLEPGYVLVLEGKDDDEDARLTITVLPETKDVAGVETRVVEEREEIGGKVVEISRNYFAISKRTSSVYYFGEDVDIFEDGKVVRHEGAWLAGTAGANFGLMMTATPLLGARYYQEVAPGVALDRAEIVGLDETVETPCGTFTGCLKTRESTPLERGTEHKRYAPGVGLVQEEGLKLVKHGRK